MSFDYQKLAPATLHDELVRVEAEIVRLQEKRLILIAALGEIAAKTFDL